MGDTRPRSGSTYENASGQVVVRQKHMWRPPTTQKTEDSQQLRPTKREVRDRRHRQKLQEWLEEHRVSDALVNVFDNIDEDTEQRVIYQQELFYCQTKKNYENLYASKFLRLPFTGSFRKRAMLNATHGTPLNVTKENEREARKLRALPTELVTEELQRQEGSLLDDLRRLRAKNAISTEEERREVLDATKRIWALKNVLVVRAMGGDTEADSYLSGYEDRVWGMMLDEYATYGDNIINCNIHLPFDTVADIAGVDEETLGVYVWTGMISPHPQSTLRESQEDGRTVVKQVDLDDDPLNTRTFRAKDVIGLLRDTAVKLTRENGRFVPANLSP